MGSARLWVLMLLPGGLAVGHLLGYGTTSYAGGAGSASGHGYIAQLSVVAVPVTVAVLVRAFVAGARGDLAGVRFAHLALQQAVLYTGVELVEHAVDGTGPVEVLAERSLFLGVVLQVLVAGAFSLLVQLFRQLGVVVASVMRRRGGRRRSSRPWAVVTSADARLLVDVVCVSRRGPPVWSVLA